MKIIDNTLVKVHNSSNYVANSPNFQSKKIIKTVTGPNSWKFASAASAAIGAGLLALAKNNNEDYSSLEKFLSEQTVNIKSGVKEAAHTPQEIKFIVEMFKENPDLVTQLILMRSGNHIVDCPRFKATEIRTILNFHKENPQLTEKLLYSGTVCNDEITKYAFSTDDIVKLVELSKTHPEFIDKILDIRQENFDKSYSTRFTKGFEYQYLTNAYKKNPVLTEYLLAVPKLRAVDVLDIANTFSTPEFFMELRDTLPEKLHYDTGIINNINLITKLMQTPIQDLDIEKKKFLLNFLTKNSRTSTVDIYRRNIPDLDLKIKQLKVALGQYAGNIATTPDAQKIFIKNVLANNNKKTEDVLKNFNFVQYGKEGLPLVYTRKDFINKRCFSKNANIRYDSFSHWRYFL